MSLLLDALKKAAEQKAAKSRKEIPATRPSDETEISPGAPGSRKSGEMTIQQVIRPADSPEEMGENSELQVWGERRGERVVAEVLVFRVVEG